MKISSRIWMFMLFFFCLNAVWAQEAIAGLSESTQETFSPEFWNIHFQTTFLPQYHGPFPAAYTGSNSLSSGSELNLSFTATLFLGLKAWEGGFLYADPEVPAGSGFSHVTGLADFSNGEISKVGTESPTYNQARIYFQQVLGFGGEREKTDDDQNQLAASLDLSRLTVTAGKFSLNDFFDNNAYAHDARTQFINLALVDNLAWDYAADTHGYTLGLLAELNQKDWAARFGEALVSTVANGPDYDWNITQARSDNAEVEWRYDQGPNPGKLRLLGYVNHAHMGDYQAALDLSPSNPDVTQTRAYRDKYGLGLSWEQALNDGLGVFGRLGWNNGTTESWELTAVDQTASVGAVLKGSAWGRADDQAGLGLVINGLSPSHQAYLAAGGLDFNIGDGALHYAPEEVAELYYLFKPLSSLGLTLDLQGIANPAYNQDRGPVGILSGGPIWNFKKDCRWKLSKDSISFFASSWNWLPFSPWAPGGLGKAPPLFFIGPLESAPRCFSRWPGEGGPPQGPPTGWKAFSGWPLRSSPSGRRPWPLFWTATTGKLDSLLL